MRRLTLLTAPLLAAGLLVGLPPTADAAPSQTCAVTESVTYSPPMTNATQTITVTVDAHLTCSSGSATSGSYRATFDQPGLSCNLVATGQGVVSFTWSDPDAEPSVFAHTSYVAVVNGTFQVVLIGSITAGAFAGNPAKEFLLAPQLDPTACSTGGITRHTYTGVLVIG